jgi:hypothetical protein
MFSGCGNKMDIFTGYNRTLQEGDGGNNENQSFVPSMTVRANEV